MALLLRSVLNLSRFNFLDNEDLSLSSRRPAALGKDLPTLVDGSDLVDGFDDVGGSSDGQRTPGASMPSLLLDDDDFLLLLRLLLPSRRRLLLPTGRSLLFPST